MNKPPTFMELNLVRESGVSVADQRKMTNAQWTAKFGALPRSLVVG